MGEEDIIPDGLNRLWDNNITPKDNPEVLLRQYLERAGLTPEQRAGLLALFGTGYFRDKPMRETKGRDWALEPNVPKTYVKNIYNIRLDCKFHL